MMTLDDLYKHYGSRKMIAQAAGVTENTVSKWAGRGSVPLKVQYKIQIKTNGKLVARGSK